MRGRLPPRCGGESGRGGAWRQGVPKIVDAHCTQATEMQVSPVHQHGRWFQPLGPEPLPLAGLAASRLSLGVPTDELSYLAFKVGFRDLGCALVCFLGPGAETLPFTLHPRAFPCRLDADRAMEEPWCLLGVCGKLVSLYLGARSLFRLWLAISRFRGPKGLLVTILFLHTENPVL